MKNYKIWLFLKLVFNNIKVIKCQVFLDQGFPKWAISGIQGAISCNGAKGGK